jgi:hypothetical protein
MKIHAMGLKKHTALCGRPLSDVERQTSAIEAKITCADCQKKVQYALEHPSGFGRSQKPGKETPNEPGHWFMGFWIPDKPDDAPLQLCRFPARRMEGQVDPRFSQLLGFAQQIQREAQQELLPGVPEKELKKKQRLSTRQRVRELLHDQSMAMGSLLDALSKMDPRDSVILSPKGRERFVVEPTVAPFLLVAITARTYPSPHRSRDPLDFERPDCLLHRVAPQGYGNLLLSDGGQALDQPISLRNRVTFVYESPTTMQHLLSGSGNGNMGRGFSSIEVEVSTGQDHRIEAEIDLWAITGPIAVLKRLATQRVDAAEQAERTPP